MTDRVFPSSSRQQNGAGASYAAGPSAAAAKSQLYNPTARGPYRAAGASARRSGGSRRRCLCQCCIWTTILILFLILLAAAAAAVVYLLYRPHRPAFTVASLRLSRFNLSSGDSPRLSSNLSLTVSAHNPNSKVAFFYDPFTVSVPLRDGDASLGNSSFAAFDHLAKNTTLIKATILGAQDLDADSYTALRSDLKKRSRVPLEVHLDTKVRVKMGGFKSKKLGIRVSCVGIEGIPPKGGKSNPSIDSISSGAKCEVDLRIKIWKFTL